jgi:hypothetical protein
MSKNKNQQIDDAHIQAHDAFFKLLSEEDVNESFKKICPDLPDITHDINGKELSFDNSSNRKPANATLALTKEHIQELTYIYQHPIYAIRNYFKIVSIDKGLINFDLYPYQIDIIKNFLGEKRCILKLPRQSGKCYSSMISITYIKKPRNIFKRALFAICKYFVCKELTDKKISLKI